MTLPTYDDDLIPEHLYISTALSAGKWAPHRNGLTADHFPASPQMYRFLTEYAQRSEGKAPPVELFAKKFPSYSHVEGVDQRWAADRLLRLYDATRMSDAMRKAVAHLSDEHIDAAAEVLRGSIKTLRDRAAGVGLDQVELGERPPGIPALYPTLEVAGGLEEGNYILIAARPNGGKSWRLMQHAVACAAEGRRVVYFSLEMTARVCADRFHRIIHGDKAVEWDWGQRTKATREWMESSGGSIAIKDPSTGQVTPESVARACDAGHVACVDYVGLMSTSSGSRSSEDWRVATAISNGLREVTLAEGITLFAGVQLNRDGDRGDAGVTQLSQADALGQDADVAVMLRKPGRSVTINTIIKNRHGTSGDKWYSAFNPKVGDFSVMEPEKAWRIIEMETNQE